MYAGIGGVFLLTNLKETDGGLLEGVFASSEKLSVVVESIPRLLVLRVLFIALVLLILVLGELFRARILVLFGALLRVSGFLVFASVGLGLFLLSHFTGNDLTTLEVLVNHSELMAVVGFSWVVLLSKFKQTVRTNYSKTVTVKVLSYLPIWPSKSQAQRKYRALAPSC